MHCVQKSSILWTYCSSLFIDVCFFKAVTGYGILNITNPVTAVMYTQFHSLLTVYSSRFSPDMEHQVCL